MDGAEIFPEEQERRQIEHVIFHMAKVTAKISRLISCWVCIGEVFSQDLSLNSLCYSVHFQVISTLRTEFLDMTFA